MLETVVHALFIILATLGVVAGIVVVVAAAVLLYIAVSWTRVLTDGVQD